MTFSFLIKWNISSTGTDCIVDEWGSWNECSELCGYGTQRRKRKILRHRQHGGKRCPVRHEKRACVGDQCYAVQSVEYRGRELGGKWCQLVLVCTFYILQTKLQQMLMTLSRENSSRFNACRNLVLLLLKQGIQVVFITSLQSQLQQDWNWHIHPQLTFASSWLICISIISDCKVIRNFKYRELIAVTLNNPNKQYFRIGRWLGNIHWFPGWKGHRSRSWRNSFCTCAVLERLS